MLRSVFRNFVGWTEVPPRFRDVITEDRERGEKMMRRDRSVVQRRFAFCRVRLRVSDDGDYAATRACRCVRP